MKKFITAFAVTASLIACQQKTEAASKEVVPETTISENVEKQATSSDFTGNYVDAAYADRTKGNDWVSAAVNKLDENTITVSIRSRSDIKKPTCTFDTKATKKSDNIYEAKANDANVLFTFEGDKISISTENPNDASKLMYFCSGGGNFVGSYTKISEPLDEKQVDKTPVKF